MEEMISLCGDDCGACPRYTVAAEEELESVAGLWHRLGFRDRVVSADEIRCSGCRTQEQCTYGLKECTRKHGVERCRTCREYPCGRIREVLKRTREVKKVAEERCTNEEFLILSKAFFEKEKNLGK